MKKLISFLMAIALALGTQLVGLPVANAQTTNTVTPFVIEQAGNVSFELSTERTMDGAYSAKLHVENLTDVHQGIKIAVNSPWNKLYNISPWSIWFNANGDLLYEGTALHSPYTILVIDLGADTAHGRLVSLHMTDSNSGGPRNYATSPPWRAIWPENEDLWNGFFVDGKDLGEFLQESGGPLELLGTDGVVGWPFKVGDLQYWHDQISALFPNYTLKYLGIAYGFVYPSYAGSWTIYVDDLWVNNVLFNFEPPAPPAPPSQAPAPIPPQETYGWTVPSLISNPSVIQDTLVGKKAKIILDSAAIASLGGVKVLFFVDGKLRKIDKKAPFDFKLKMKSGTHTLTIKIFDSQGNLLSQIENTYTK